MVSFLFPEGAPLRENVLLICASRRRPTYTVLTLDVSPLKSRNLAVFGVASLFLSMCCGVLCMFIGVGSNLGTALAATVFCSHIQNLLLIGEDGSTVVYDHPPVCSQTLIESRFVRSVGLLLFCGGRRMTLWYCRKHGFSATYKLQPERRLVIPGNTAQHLRWKPKETSYTFE